jgi:DNA polymerase-3 subunit delta
MKLRIEQLAQHIKKQLSPIYLITGDELLLVQETITLLNQATQHAGYQEKIIIEANNNDAWLQLTHEMQNLSLFSSKRVIECRIAQAKFGDAGGKTLQHYAQHPPKDTVLFIVTSKLTSAQQNTAWFKAIDKVGVIIQIWPITGPQLPVWIRQRIKTAGLLIDNNGVQLLVDHVQGNLLAAAQEIEKLQLLFGNNTITSEQIADSITGNNRFNIFELGDCLLRGDAQYSLQILQCFRSEGNEPVLILWSITRELRTLINIAFELQNGMTFSQIMHSFAVREQRKPLIQHALKRHSYQEWLLLLQKAAQVDRVIKGMQLGNVWDELQQLCLAITEKQYLPHMEITQ